MMEKGREGNVIVFNPLKVLEEALTKLGRPFRMTTYVNVPRIGNRAR